MVVLKKQINNNSTFSVNTIRVLAAEIISKAKSGHTGIALGAAPIMYALFHDHLVVNPTQPQYFNRDRFILSAGHGSALLYATMLVCRYSSIKMDDIKNFRQLGSKCPGHPEKHLLEGVEFSTGPLGQGIATAVGMAIAETKLAAQINKYNQLINHHTYALCGDGCLQEGVAQEAMALAGRLKLNKLIVLYDSNRIQLDGKVNDSTNFNVRKLASAYHWHYIKVPNANNTAWVSNAISQAKNSGRPTIIECCSNIGFGSALQDTNACHGVPLNPQQLIDLKQKLEYNVQSFVVHPTVISDMDELKFRGIKHQQEFNLGLQKIEARDLPLYNYILSLEENKFNFDLNWYKLNDEKAKIATRHLISSTIQPFIENNKTVMVGAADVSASTMVKAVRGYSYDVKKRDGQNILYGVREFAMAAISNGIVAHGGLKSICSTFLAFSDYCKNAIRLAAISQVPTIYIFTHDTITVGEDGPTHQPIEQLWSLRLIPNHNLFRPFNQSETIAAIESAISSTTTPTTIIGSRGDFESIPSSIELARKGGYILVDAKHHTLNIVAAGSEVETAIQVAKLLSKNSVSARVISMPSTNIFDQQPEEYRLSVIDKKPTVCIEFGSTPPWYKYGDLVIGIDQFGQSGKPADVVKHFNLTPQDIADKILAWLKK